MNKKLISILLIISLLTVGFTCISATDLSTNAENSVTPEVTSTESSADSTENQNANTTDNDTNTTNMTENETEGYPDVVVPTKTEDLEKFNVIMNFVTPDGKKYFADQLAQIDNESYKDVITALNNNDMDHLFYYLGQLDQNKIDTFFTTFLNIFDTTQNNTQDSTSTNSNSITDTISNILGTSQSQKTVGNQFIKTNPNLADSNKYSNQNNPMYTFNNKQYSLVDFVLALKVAYEHGEINFDQFIQVLKDNGIDTSDIKCENGVIQWGFLYIIGPNGDDTNNSTNATEPVTNSSSAFNDTGASTSNVDSSTENPSPDDHSSNAKSEGNATA